MFRIFIFPFASIQSSRKVHFATSLEHDSAWSRPIFLRMRALVFVFGFSMSEYSNRHKLVVFIRFKFVAKEQTFVPLGKPTTFIMPRNLFGTEVKKDHPHAENVFIVLECFADLLPRTSDILYRVKPAHSVLQMLSS